MAQLVKNPLAMWETWVLSLGWEDPLDKGMLTHCSILAWRIPMDRGGPWGRKELDMTEQLSTEYSMYIYIYIYTYIYMYIYIYIYIHCSPYIYIEVVQHLFVVRKLPK